MPNGAHGRPHIWVARRRLAHCFTDDSPKASTIARPLPREGPLELDRKLEIVLALRGCIFCVHRPLSAAKAVHIGGWAKIKVGVLLQGGSRCLILSVISELVEVGHRSLYVKEVGAHNKASRYVG